MQKIPFKREPLLFIVGMVEHWSRVTEEAVESPSLGIAKT